MPTVAPMKTSLPSDVEGPAHGGDDALGDGVGLHAAAVVLEQHGELVAAETRRGVRRARAVGQAGGRGAQQLVAGGVADAVVDGLEAVEVDEEHAQLGLAADRDVEARAGGGRGTARGWAAR